MESSKGLRKTKGFKQLSTFVTSLFLFTTIANSVPSTTITKADTGVQNNTSAFKELNVDWTRTFDIREKGSFNVHNSISKFDKYWTQNGSEYTMKAYDSIDSKGTSGVDADKDQEGIFLMQQLFTGNKKTVTFDYDSLTKIMGATDTNAWDGKGSNPYSKYRQSVVNGYLATNKGDYYHLRDIQNPKNPTTNIKREDDFTLDSYPDFATWYYMPYDGSTRGTEQMRLFQGKFTIAEGDIDKYNYYLTSGDNKDNILAIDDTVMVLVDGMPTNINYTTANYNNTTVKLKNGAKTYDMTFNQSENCRKENNLPVTCDIGSADGNRHAAYSVFTDTLHVHLGQEIKDSINGSKVLGDVTENISAFGGTNHKIEVIASDYNLSGGMTKLNIIRVAKPTTSLIKDAYVSDKLVASSRDGSSSTVKNDDNITYKFTYQNKGEAPLYNILFEDNLLNAIIGVKDGKNIVSIGGKSYDLKDVSVEKYDASGKLIKSSDASILADKSEALNKGEYIVVSSDKLIHKPTANEIKNEKVENTVTTSANYEGYYTEERITDKAEAKVTVKVNENPKIQVVKEAYGDNNYSNLLASSDPAKAESQSAIAKGQNAYYKFIIKNIGDVVLNNITINDNDLKVSVNASKYSAKDSKNLIIEKYDANGTKVEGISGLDALKTLGVSESIVVYDKNNILKTCIESTFKNTVKAEGTTPSNNTVKGDASVSVTPKDPSINVIKTAFTNVATKASVTNVAIGEKVYYKFIAENNSNTDLVNVKFIDDSFNGKDSIKITEDGVFINNVKEANTTVEVTKYDVNGDSTKGGLELLGSLKIGEKVAFTDIANLYRTITADDNGKALSNTVTGYGTFKGPGEDKEVEDTDTVVVTPTIQKINVTKTASILDVNSENGKKIVANSEKPEECETIKSGTKVYYTIGLENAGPYKMTNIVFTDDTLKLDINSKGITKNGVSVDSKNTKVVKYQINNKEATLEEGGLELLGKELIPGWKIEVLNDDCLNDSKVLENGTILNTVRGKGDYKISENGDSKSTDYDDATVVVPVDNDSDVKPEMVISKIKVQKQAFVSGEKVADSEQSDIYSKINVGKTIDYTITVTNTGNETLKNIEINDLDLSLKINKNGITKTGAIVSNSLGFKISKLDKDGSLISAGTVKDLSSILSELKPSEKLVVSDEALLSYTSTSTGIVNNKVVAQGEGKSKNPSDNAEVKVPVIDSKVDITKDVYKITRDGNTIYDKTKDSIDPASVRVYPGDKVQFTYTIKNNTEVKVDNLFIKDILTNTTMPDFKNVTDWTFTKNGEKFNHNKFSLNAGESINLLSNEWTVPDNCKRDVINTVELYQNLDDGTSKFINKDDAKIIVYPRVYVNMDCKSDTEKQFYVKVTGDNGFETSMYIKDKDKVEISDLLDFDVNYTITETIPMNFTFNGIDIEKGTDINGNKKQDSSMTFNLMTVTHPENITLHNEKRNSEEFQADSEVTNTLKYAKK